RHLPSADLANRRTGSASHRAHLKSCISARAGRKTGGRCRGRCRAQNARRQAAVSYEINAALLDVFRFLVPELILGAAACVLLLVSWDEVPDRQAAEYYACLLLIIAGLCLTGSANELVTLFLSLEIISIPTYVLLYLPRHDNPAQEAALKYFLLSIFASALLLF